MEINKEELKELNSNYTSAFMSLMIIKILERELIPINDFQKLVLECRKEVILNIIRGINCPRE